jgi:septum formation protein
VRLVLASSSPRRREILGWLGLEYEVVEPEVEELTEGMGPEELVLENARRKALAGRALAGAAGETVVLGSETEVFLDGVALGKPRDEAEAREHLEALSGRTHDVISGIFLAGPGAQERSGVERSLVTFAALDEPTLRAYLASGEWAGRAGGYAIQGLGSLLVDRVEGDFSNVVGLPLRLLLRLAPELAEKP